MPYKNATTAPIVVGDVIRYIAFPGVMKQHCNRRKAESSIITPMRLYAGAVYGELLRAEINTKFRIVIDLCAMKAEAGETRTRGTASHRQGSRCHTARTVVSHRPRAGDSRNISSRLAGVAATAAGKTVDQGHQRREHGDHDEPDDTAQKYDHNRFQRGSQALHFASTSDS